MREVLGGIVANQRTFMDIILDIKSGQDRLASAQLHLSHEQQHLHTLSAQTMAAVEDIADRLDGMETAMSRAPLPPAVRVLDKVIEWLPKIASNWAPISAAVVALYKWGIPYLRQLLGLP